MTIHELVLLCCVRGGNLSRCISLQKSETGSSAANIDNVPGLIATSSHAGISSPKPISGTKQTHNVIQVLLL